MADYGPGYRLLWPVDVFQAEARDIAAAIDAPDIHSQAALLIEEVFAGAAPVRDFAAVSPVPGWAADLLSERGTPEFLRQLAQDASQFPTAPRRYWRQRQQPAPIPAVLTIQQVQAEWLQLVAEFDTNGYLDALAESPCVDGSTEEERNADISARLTEEAGYPIEWPLGVPDDGWPDDHFYTLIELVHDVVARPRTRTFHDYGHDYHWSDFAAATGQRLYRWRVSELLRRSTVHLQLADDGLDKGFLVLSPPDGRDDLAQRTLNRPEDANADPVARAVLQFRDRHADRIQKRAACVLLAGELEQQRNRVKRELLSNDEGMLFQIANQFAIRHHRADQHPDYDDAYLDWVFWMYLATVELMRTLADRGE